jgi:Arc/MetJ-type ribon-helix-helix transcriptional regulator
MAYQFPPDVEELVKKQMVSGAYSSEDDLLRDALRALNEQKGSVTEEDPEVVEGIRRGLEDMKAGRSQPLAQFDAEFRTRHNIPRNV